MLCTLIHVQTARRDGLRCPILFDGDAIYDQRDIWTSRTALGNRCHSAVQCISAKSEQIHSCKRTLKPWFPVQHHLRSKNRSMQQNGLMLFRELHISVSTSHDIHVLCWQKDFGADEEEHRSCCCRVPEPA